jgi:hypothetical protein
MGPLYEGRRCTAELRLELPMQQGTPQLKIQKTFPPNKEPYMGAAARTLTGVTLHQTRSTFKIEDPSVGLGRVDFGDRAKDSGRVDLGFEKTPKPKNRSPPKK